MNICFKQCVSMAKHGGTSADAWLSYWMELAFVPPVGMEVCCGEVAVTVDQLCYKDGVVFAICPKNRDVPHQCRTFDDVLEEYTSSGWTKSKGILSVD